jgi:hypothetical protein
VQVADSSFGGLLEGAADARVCVDRRGRIARVNAQTERLFGYQRDELVGEPVEILIPEMVLSARRRDGSTFPAEISLSTIDTDDGLVVIAAVRDVTERLESTGQLGGGVAQDVSNLLAVISNYAAFVGDEVAKDGAQVSHAGGNPQDPVPLRLHRHRRRHRPRGHRDRRKPYR